jgi:hypothetical protein
MFFFQFSKNGGCCQTAGISGSYSFLAWKPNPRLKLEKPNEPFVSKFFLSLIEQELYAIIKIKRHL